MTVREVLGWTSIPDAASKLNVTRVTVYIMLADGRLVGERVAGRLCVTAESLEKLIAERAS